MIVKPHPASVLPAAISVRIAREVLREAGLDPNLVTLAVVDRAETTQQLAHRPARGVDRLHRRLRLRPLAARQRAQASRSTPSSPA
ncbi:MAG: hypothetical protein MZW92_69765 [Comamonadaceae bacterium]|nr:hypothetical protein [Comamonadaceae bacterium]